MTAAGPATASSGRPCGGWHDLLRPRGHWTCGERNWQGLTASDAREHELFVQFEYVTSPVRIPDGGGWRIHGRGSTESRAVERTKKRGTRRGYVYFHSAVDGHTRLAYTEALDDEKGMTAVEFLERARTWFAAHGITRMERIVTDNGACYRSKVFAEAVTPARHQRIRPYTPRHNGKVERYNRILAEEYLYARTWHSEQERADGLVLWNLHYNYHRPHGAHHGQPPASAAPAAVNNVLASYN